LSYHVLFLQIFIKIEKNQLLKEQLNCALNRGAFSIPSVSFISLFFFSNEQKALWFSKINRMSFSKSFVFRMTYHFIFFPLILLKLKEPRFHFFEESEIHEIHI